VTPPIPRTGYLPFCISMEGDCWLEIGRVGFLSGYIVSVSFVDLSQTSGPGANYCAQVDYLHRVSPSFPRITDCSHPPRDTIS